MLFAGDLLFLRADDSVGADGWEALVTGDITIARPASRRRPGLMVVTSEVDGCYL
jgi:hypothetical protein